MTRPSFATTIAALRTTDRRAPHTGPTAYEADAADALEVLQEFHTGTADQPDTHDRWGRCSTCDTPWPCEAWQWGEQLALQSLGRAQDRVAAHARTVLDQTATRSAA